MALKSIQQIMLGTVTTTEEQTLLTLKAIRAAGFDGILKSDSMELGTGNMDLGELIEQALLVNVAAIVLESHKNWTDKSPIRSIEVSGEYLKKFEL